MSGQISVLRLEPDGTVGRETIGSELGSLQAAVGGYIEFVYRCNLGPGIIGIVDEDGKGKGLMPNPYATDLFDWMGTAANPDYIAGPMLLATIRGDDVGSYPHCSLDDVAISVGAGGIAEVGGFPFIVGKEDQ